MPPVDLRLLTPIQDSVIVFHENAPRRSGIDRRLFEQSIARKESAPRAAALQFISLFASQTAPQLALLAWTSVLRGIATERLEVSARHSTGKEKSGDRKQTIGIVGRLVFDGGHNIGYFSEETLHARNLNCH
jgi:hypothetical protein